MAVPAVNLTIDKGTDFSTSIRLKKDGANFDLTGATITAKIRKHYSASSYYTFSSTSSSPSSGIVTLSISNATTSQIPVGRYVYDVLVTKSGSVTKVVEGTVIVKGTSS